MKKHYSVLLLLLCFVLLSSSCSSNVKNIETEESDKPDSTSNSLGDLVDGIFGNDDEDDDFDSPTRFDKLHNQYETKCYYLRQGYTSDWKVSLCDPDGKLVSGHEDQGLVLQLVPNAEEKGVYYNVFCNWGKDIGMTANYSDIAKMVANESGKLAFNRINYVEKRDEYCAISDITTRVYNKMAWNCVKFNFINQDGDLCKGVWNLLSDGTNFYIVSYEATADKFDTYHAQFEEMLNDFKKIGFEKE